MPKIKGFSAKISSISQIGGDHVVTVDIGGIVLSGTVHLLGRDYGQSTVITGGRTPFRGR